MEPINKTDMTIKTVLHPTDFSEASTNAFHHALKVTLLTKSKFNILSVAAAGSESEDFPGIRETLERSLLLPKGSPRSAVTKPGIDPRKLIAKDMDTVDAGFLSLK